MRLIFAGFLIWRENGRDRGRSNVARLTICTTSPLRSLIKRRSLFSFCRCFNFWRKNIPQDELLSLDSRRVFRSLRSTAVVRVHASVSDRLSSSSVHRKSISPTPDEKWPKIFTPTHIDDVNGTKNDLPSLIHLPRSTTFRFAFRNRVQSLFFFFHIRFRIHLKERALWKTLLTQRNAKCKASRSFVIFSSLALKPIEAKSERG